MPRGRPRMPDQVHDLRGTYRKDRHGDPATKRQQSSKAPTMPREFDARRKRIWNGVKKELSPLGLWSSTYGMTVRLLVDTFAHYLDYEADIAENGKIHETPKLNNRGEPVTYLDGDHERRVVVRKSNPAVRDRNNCVIQMRGLLTELGLGPSALSRLAQHAAGDGDDVDLMDFLAGNAN